MQKSATGPFEASILGIDAG